MQHTFSMTADYDGRHRDASGWEHDRWKVEITHHDDIVGDETFRTAYRMGIGHNGAAPTIADVLESLAYDASAADAVQSFSDYCDEMWDGKTRPDVAHQQWQDIKRECSRVANWFEYIGVDPEALREVLETTEVDADTIAVDL